MPPRESITEAIVNMDEAAALRLVEEKLASGADPVEVLEECRRGMFAVGERFEKGEMYLSELFMASEMFNQITARVKPLLGKAEQKRGKIVIGTVEGDVHDIGKNIFTSLLEAEGFEVVDLGVDVPPSRFVEAIREHHPEIVGMSSLLSTSLDAVKRTVDAIEEAGLRDKVRIIVGGGRIDEQAAEYIVPDAYTDNASHGRQEVPRAPRGGINMVDNAELFKQRRERMRRAIDLKEPDRVPLIESHGYFAARNAGITSQEFLSDYAKAGAASVKAAVDFGYDTASGMNSLGALPLTLAFVGEGDGIMPGWINGPVHDILGVPVREVPREGATRRLALPVHRRGVHEGGGVPCTHRRPEEVRRRGAPAPLHEGAREAGLSPRDGCPAQVGRRVQEGGRGGR